jgi:hypothetical protein
LFFIEDKESITVNGYHWAQFFLYNCSPAILVAFSASLS